MGSRTVLGIVVVGYALAALPAWAWTGMPLPVALWSVLLAAGLILLTGIDIAQYRLPDALTLPLLLAGLVATWQIGAEPLLWHVAGAAGGYLVLVLVAALYRAWRQREGLGMGDAKLMAAAGAWLGLAVLPSALLLGCLFGIVHAVVCGLAERSLEGTRRIPFGPALCLATWICWLYGPLRLPGLFDS